MSPNPIRSNYCHGYNDRVVRARYKDVVDALAADISAGKIPPGTRLPTHRELAGSLARHVAAAGRLPLLDVLRLRGPMPDADAASGAKGRSNKWVNALSI